ncbi:MAG: transcription elongation factor GreA [bacterium]|nr:transcription elongation factor GreA [bacterium]
MTERGHEMLHEELKRLKGFERPAVVEAIKVAREHGDLSENAEYDAAKDKQGMIEARIRMIEDRLARAEVVPRASGAQDRVRFATMVVLEDLDSGDEVTYSIVGEDEADISKGLLSVTSPVARALIGKAVEDVVEVRVPAGTREYEVIKILPLG